MQNTLFSSVHLGNTDPIGYEKSLLDIYPDNSKEVQVWRFGGQQNASFIGNHYSRDCHIEILWLVQVGEHANSESYRHAIKFLVAIKDTTSPSSQHSQQQSLGGKRKSKDQQSIRKSLSFKRGETSGSFTTIQARKR